MKKTRNKTVIHQQEYNARIETIFSELLELNVLEREAALKKLDEQQPTLKAEVESLLFSADKAKGFLSVSPVPAVSKFRANEKSWIGQKLGAYRLIRELGRGGMGTVFLAERADGEYKKQVAIKLVNHVVDTELTLRRFKAERQILANLQHPNIASLLDGGTTEDGFPYLVMEYIQGVPIDSYCQSTQLTIKEKLELFIKVCYAVDYAHQNQIVHQDLKPANILITVEGLPKLLDFGIAKLLESEQTSGKNEPKTLLEFPLMTPEYASPEQLLGEPVTIATDVYSLGVILYELLSSQRPYQLSSHNVITIAQTICDEIIPPPSQCKPELGSQMEGDLDNITLFALRKEPELRYQPVNNLSEDLEHHLAGKPVIATKDSVGYRLTKFVKRNKLGVSLSGLVVLVLFAGIISATWQWQIAKKEQKRADQHYQEVRGLANAMAFDVPDSIAKLPGSTKLRRSILNKGVVHLDRLAQQHEDDKKLQNETARAYSKLAMILKKSVELRFW